MQPRTFICLLVFNLGFFLNVNSQTYKVKYHNFANNIIPQAEEVTTLLLTPEASVNWTVPYKYYSTAIREKTAEGKFVYRSNHPADTLKRFIYRNRSNRSMSFESRFPYVYNKMKVIQDTLDCIKWEVKSETRIIFNYKCVKAITFFRGRTYIAWFAPDIPISDGPWKFNGLPGLIFEVYDMDKKFLWTLSSFEKVTEILPEFPETNNGTYPEFKRLYQEMFYKIKKSLEAKQSVTDPSCKGCTNSIMIEASTPEKLLEN